MGMRSTPRRRQLIFRLGWVDRRVVRIVPPAGVMSVDQSGDCLRDRKESTYQCILLPRSRESWVVVMFVAALTWRCD